MSFLQFGIKRKTLIVMKIIKNVNSIKENKRLLGDLIDTHLESVESLFTDNEKKKKILEINHVGKFLMLLDAGIQIDKLFEAPDFVLKFHSGKKVGLEHRTIIDGKAKSREGFFEDIFSVAESELQNNLELPNFFVSCHLNPYLSFMTNQKRNLIQIIISVVREYILTGILLDNPLIDKISKIPDSYTSINVVGAWWVNYITTDLITEAIRQKEEKIRIYRENSVNIQWLLIVIGQLGKSSFNIKKDLELDFKTEFDKVFILEDFYNNLYELK